MGLVQHINTSLPVKWKKCTCGETTHFVNWMDLITLCCWGCSTLEQYRVQLIPGLCKGHYIYFLFIDFRYVSLMWKSSCGNNNSASLILPSLLCHGHLQGIGLFGPWQGFFALSLLNLCDWMWTFTCISVSTDSIPSPALGPFLVFLLGTFRC